jgi:hypothetical protein
VTRTGIEPTIYCTWGEHANPYNIYAVETEDIFFLISLNLNTYMEKEEII